MSGRSPAASRRVRTALGMGVREYARTPVLLALLVVLPAYFVFVVVSVVPETPLSFTLDGTALTLPTDEVYAVLVAPMVAALVGGIAGLFSMLTARAADARLVLAGYRPREVVLARFGLLVGVGSVVTAASVGVLLVHVTPDHLAWFAAATLLLAVTYGLLGVLAGIVVDRLAGVYLMLFGPTVDLFLFQNPTVADPSPVATLLPGHFAMALAVDAAFAAVDLVDAGLAVAYLAGLAAVATAALYRTTRVR